MKSGDMRSSRNCNDAIELACEHNRTLTPSEIELERRSNFLAGLNADFAASRANAELWQDELAERRMWDTTLSDGLEPD